MERCANDGEEHFIALIGDKKIPLKPEGFSLAQIGGHQIPSCPNSLFARGIVIGKIIRFAVKSARIALRECANGIEAWPRYLYISVKNGLTPQDQPSARCPRGTQAVRRSQCTIADKYRPDSLATLGFFEHLPAILVRLAPCRLLHLNPA